VALATILLAGSSPARAAFPGRNGLMLFTRAGSESTPQIWVMNADGSGQRNLTRNRGTNLQPRWSRDGTRIAYSCVPPDREDQDICVMDADGAHQRNLTSASRAQESQPAWSPSRPDVIVFQSTRGNADPNDTDVYAMNADGSRVRRLTATPAREEQPVWAPGTDRLALIRSTRFDDHELFVMTPSGTDLMRVEPSLLPVNTTDPDWSPDGRSIGVTGVVPGEAPQVYVVDPASGRATQLTRGPVGNTMPRFSPDGRSIVFVSLRDAGIAHVFRMNADGTNVRQLTFGTASDGSPDWQPSPMTVPLRVTLRGPGRVTSTPGGIDCGTACAAYFEPGAAVTLHARADGDAAFVGWSGDCAGRSPACRVELRSARSVRAVFRQLARIVVVVSGRGTVRTIAPAERVCADRCSLSVVPNEPVVLTARPADGWTFASWSGACSGTDPLCTLVARGRIAVGARFVRRRTAAVSSAALVGTWRQSMFSGSLVVAGHIDAGPRAVLRLSGGFARQTVEFKRPAPAGAFRWRLRLPRGLLPGEYELRLRAGDASSPVVARPRGVTLAAPPEGVAARAFVSAARGGPPVTVVHAGTRELWARFDLAALPREGALTVTWYGPDGLASAPPVGKPARSLVESFVRASRGALRPGTWRCTLRAGDVVVASAEARVG
jgi:hypothetical protein